MTDGTLRDAVPWAGRPQGQLTMPVHGCTPWRWRGEKIGWQCRCGKTEHVAEKHPDYAEEAKT